MNLGKPIKEGVVIPVVEPISVPAERPAPKPVKEKENA